MRLSKITLIFLGVGIFAILAIGMGMAYAQQSREQSRLNEQLSLAQLRISNYSPQKLSSQLEGLKSELTQLETQLKDSKACLCQSVESIEATDTLFEIAEVCGVEIIGVSSPGLNSKEIEGIACPVLAVTVQIEGDVSNLIDFTLKLTGEFPTGVVQSVGINIPEVPEEAEAEEMEEEQGEEEESEEEAVGEEEEEGIEEEELEKPSATLVLLIHTYEGD